MIDLPKNWVICNIADITSYAEIIKIRSIKDHKIQYIDISSIDNMLNRVSEPKNLMLSKAPSRARQVVKAGDVLFATVRPYLRNIAQVPDYLDGQIASTGFAVLRPATGIVPSYLFYKTLSRDFVSSLTGEQYGVSYPAVKEEQVRSQPFELPPTAEQHRIVAKIEELFSELDAATESLTRARAQLKTYRQALLKAAFEGKLTADWRAANPDKIESSETLLSRIRAEREGRYARAMKDWEKALAEWRADGEVGVRPAKPVKLTEIILSENPVSGQQMGWLRVPLGLVIDEPAYGTSKKCDYESPGIGVLRIPNITNGSVDATDLKFAQFDEDDIETYRLQPGDLLIIRSNGSISLVGKAALISPSDADFLYAGYLIRLRPNPLTIEPAYLLRVMQSHGLRLQIEEKAKSTSGVNNINSKELQELLIPLSSLEEQKQIISILEAHLSALDATEAEIDIGLDKIAALRQTILKKAFSGQLVPQDPADEPASVLFARLREEAPAPKTRRKKRA